MKTMDSRWKGALFLSTLAGGVLAGGLVFGLWWLVKPRGAVSC